MPLRGFALGDLRLSLGKRIRATSGEVSAMPPPNISMSRPLRSRDPGPSIPDAPGRCPLHQGQLGWNMLMPCEACTALAFVPAVSSANSRTAVDLPGITQEATTGSMQADAFVVSNSHAEQIPFASGLASSASLEVALQGSGGVPPPLPLSLVSGIGVGGGGLCQTPVRLASSWPLMLTLEPCRFHFVDWDCLRFRSFSPIRRTRRPLIAFLSAV